MKNEVKYIAVASNKSGMPTERPLKMFIRAIL